LHDLTMRKYPHFQIIATPRIVADRLGRRHNVDVAAELVMSA
jgi:hypothetical protein